MALAANRSVLVVVGLERSTPARATRASVPTRSEFISSCVATAGRSRLELGPRVHDGTITTLKPDQMWGTDATGILPLDGQEATVLGVFDH